MGGGKRVRVRREKLSYEGRYIGMEEGKAIRKKKGREEEERGKFKW